MTNSLPHDAPNDKPSGAPLHATCGVAGIGATKQIAWLPGVVFAWAIAVALMGLSQNSGQGSLQEPILVAIATMFSMGALCGFADEEQVWVGALFTSPLAAIIAYAIATGGDYLGVHFLAAVVVGYFLIAIIWLIGLYTKGTTLLWMTLGIIFAAAIVLICGTLVSRDSTFFFSAMAVIMIAVMSAMVIGIAISVGGLFRVVYEFRRPSVGLPAGWIPRQFSLSSMFGVTTWFAVMFTVFSLEQLTLHQVAIGSLAFVIGGAVVLAVLKFHVWQNKERHPEQDGP